VNNSKKGVIGEERAAAFLKDSGYEVVAKNYRVPWGEVDLIALDESSIVFCEVKTWDSYFEESLEQAIGRKKQRRICNVAKHFLKSNPKYRFERIRFDVILLTDHMSRIRHIKNAFGVAHG
jgi:putative endonuclease